jgi:uncharacterized protein (TIGR03000 family)
MKPRILSLSVAALALVGFLSLPGVSLAQHGHGGSHGGGGHGGAVHGGSGWHGGTAWHGSTTWHGAGAHPYYGYRNYSGRYYGGYYANRGYYYPYRYGYYPYNYGYRGWGYPYYPLLGLAYGLASSVGYGGYYAPYYNSYDYAPTYYDYAPTYGAPYSYAPAYPDSSYVSQAQYAPPAAAEATVRVHVQSDAEVLFDNHLTQQTGPERVFSTPPLDPSKTFTYDVTARWTENGRDREVTRQVTVVPGRTVDVDFTSKTPVNTVR